MLASGVDQEVFDGSNSLDMTSPESLFTSSKVELSDDGIVLVSVVDLDVDVVGA